MAELVAGAFLQSSFRVIIEKLASVGMRDYFSNNNVDELVKELNIALNSINHVLEEAEIKQYQNKYVKKWLDELKHVVFEADQLLDEISTDAMLNKLKAESEPLATNLLGLVSALTTNPFECRLNEQLDKLELLAKQKEELGLGTALTRNPFDTTEIKFQPVEEDVRLNIEDYEVSQISQSAADVSQVMFEAKKTWKLVGLVSSVVGLLCYALSPSFNRLIGRWKPFKFFLYGVLSLAIFTSILVAKKSSHSTRHVQLKTYINFAFLMIISVYSLFYDKAVDGKPEVLSIVSNAAFALVSLSLHKLINIGFEIGVFSYFLGCFTVQLLTINWLLIFVAILFSCPLYVMHMNSQPEAASGGQGVHSSSHV